MEGHVSFYLINTFPIPRPDRNNALWENVVKVAGRLACPDKRFASWANAVGVKHGPLDDDEKENMIFELDALVACLYGLNESQLVHIYETLHKGWDHVARLEGVLSHFNKWKGQQ